ncbi:hypothetical protein A6P39_020665 [Streptomyces sp. FXJ1.172]|nr:hypothetical protein [Streptomyces sp. FXJ1.172]WEO96247.1 hypothetical protein A6P39_020665 [Streptomyces sp. FXJ1.172]
MRVLLVGPVGDDETVAGPPRRALRAHGHDVTIADDRVRGGSGAA